MNVGLGDSVYFPKFLIGMAATLVLTTGWIYVETESLGLSLVWVFLAAILLQVGYFVVMLAMIFVPRIFQQHKLFSKKATAADNLVADSEALPIHTRPHYLPVAPGGQDTTDLER